MRNFREYFKECFEAERPDRTYTETLVIWDSGVRDLRQMWHVLLFRAAGAQSSELSRP